MELLLAIVALALAGAAFLKVRELRERLQRLEEFVRERRVPQGETKGWSWTPTAAPTTPKAEAPAASVPPVSPPPILARPAVPEPLPPQTPPSTRTAPRPVPKIEWERWLGVRGAAVLGGIFLAVAGVLFFQYSIERGLITKEMRVAFGATVGIACIVGGEIVRRRGFGITAHAITGAGAVILYAAFWSAHLLGIFPFAVSFVLMIAVTALCCFLSWRNSSQLIAWLGLSGGFATPLLLSTGRDEPIALFSYLLLLDVAFLFVANRKRWPLVGALGLLGTYTIQGAWFFERMGPATFGIGIVSLAVFALVFAFLAPTIAASDADSRTERLRWLATRVGALLLPFAFAVQFAGRVDVGYHLYPLFLFCALLAAAAGWMARKQGTTYAPVGAAVGASAIALVWVMSNTLESARTWELVVCGLGFCAVLYAFCEWRRSQAGAAAQGHDTALAIAVAGIEVAFFAAGFRIAVVSVWPLVLGFTLAPLFLLRLDALSPRAVMPFLACVPASVAIATWTSLFASNTEVFLATLTAPIAFLAVAAIRRPVVARKISFAAAAVACFPLFFVLEVRSGPALTSSLAFLRILALGICALLGATGARSGVLVGLAAIATSLVQWGVLANIRPATESFEPGAARAGVAVLLASSAVFLFWPLLRRSLWIESRTIAWMTPLAAVFAWPPAMELWGEAHRGIAQTPPLACLALLLTAAGWGGLGGHRDEFPPEGRPKRSPLAVLAIHDFVLAAFFLGLGIATALDRPRWPPTFAALCLAAAFLWRRTDHAPLKYVALCSSALAAAIALLSALIERHWTSPYPLVGIHGFDFLLPGVAVVAAALLGHAEEARRARPQEAGLYRHGFPLMYGCVGVTGLAIVLLWITVEVENRFANGDSFRLEFGGLPARDLSLSIAWAVFALVLLLVGMGRRIGVLRWVSLVLLLATIGKVFLLDLIDLRGLYRVGSFLGLAVSLLAVSLLYQRFVFRKAARPAV